MASITSINPYTGKKLKSYKTHTNTEIKALLEKAGQRFSTWKKTPFAERSSLLKKAAEELLKNKSEYARMITLEMGKPIAQAVAEVEKCAWVCEYYAENAENQLRAEITKTEAAESYISYEPLGTILAIMPWNYPFWQVFRFTAPALMAGNVVVLKHASNVSGSALLLEKVFERAGFPANCLTTLLVENRKVEAIIENPVIKAVTLTGSGKAGASVAAAAGRNIKKTVLELGGSNALIVFKDADIETALDACIQARFQNTGQSCIAGKRLLVDESIAKEFTNQLVKKVRELKSGDPLDENTYIGVLAREDLAEELERQVNEVVKNGAQTAIGGKRKNAYFEPTVLTRVTEKMAVFAEETFGPVLSVTTFKDEDEAVRLSNASGFGLGVSLFSQDVERMKNLVPLMEEGAVFINTPVKSDPRLPFGGIKNSGYGRELGREGIREFVNVKTVVIK